jgi:ribosomal-protein-alanine N-acetyltransferase
MVTLSMSLIPTPLLEGDYPLYSALYADPRVSAPSGLPTRMDNQSRRTWFDNALSIPANQGQIWGLRQEEGGHLCGVLRLTDWEHDAGVITLGYALSPDLWGKGLMGACLAEQLPLVFAGKLGTPVNRIQAWVLDSNSRSCHLLDRLGFQREGILRRLFHNNLGLHDVCAYGLLKDDPVPTASHRSGVDFPTTQSTLMSVF